MNVKEWAERLNGREYGYREQSESVVQVSPEMMELLAADEHDRWSSQARIALNEMTAERRERWDRLSKTAYSDLTEEMKELDRMQVRERLTIMGAIQPPISGAKVREAVDVFGALCQSARHGADSGDWGSWDADDWVELVAAEKAVAELSIPNIQSKEGK